MVSCILAMDAVGVRFSLVVSFLFWFFLAFSGLLWAHTCMAPPFMSIPGPKQPVPTDIDAKMDV
jgi:hypothetical protein